MFAVFEDGGRQFTVKTGDNVTIDYRDQSKPGEAITFSAVLLANAGGASVIGQPTISDANVEAEVVDPLTKGPKIDIGRLRRRKNSRRHTGHRQRHTVVKINAINVPGLQVVAPAEQTSATN